MSCAILYVKTVRNLYVSRIFSLVGIPWLHESWVPASGCSSFTHLQLQLSGLSIWVNVQNRPKGSHGLFDGCLEFIAARTPKKDWIWAEFELERRWACEWAQRLESNRDGEGRGSASTSRGCWELCMRRWISLTQSLQREVKKSFWTG
jgi:hypothetical protein